MTIAYTPLRAQPTTVDELRKYTQDELDQIADTLNGIVTGSEDGSLWQPAKDIQFVQDSTLGIATASPNLYVGYVPPPNTPDPDSGYLEYGAQRGLLWYDDQYQALSYYNDDVNVEVKLGRDLIYRVAYLDAANLSLGDVVFVNSAALGWPIVSKAQATNQYKSRVLGIVIAAIDQFSFGYVLAFGTVRNIKTDEDSEGNPVAAGYIAYLSEVVPGGWTVGQDPVGGNLALGDLPDIRIPLGIITQADATAGQMAVSINRPPSMDGISDVSFVGNPPEYLSGLLYDPATSFWKSSNAVAIRVCEFAIAGAGVSDPTLVNTFNVDTIVKVPATTGVYEVTIDIKQVNGHDLLDYVVASIDVISGTDDPNGSGTIVMLGEFIADSVNAAAGTFRFEVYTLVVGGAGSKTYILKDAIDLEAADEVLCMVHLTGDQP